MLQKDISLPLLYCKLSVPVRAPCVPSGQWGWIPIPKTSPNKPGLHPHPNNIPQQTWAESPPQPMSPKTPWLDLHPSQCPQHSPPSMGSFPSAVPMQMSQAPHTFCSAAQSLGEAVTAPLPQHREDKAVASVSPQSPRGDLSSCGDLSCAGGTGHPRKTRGKHVALPALPQPVLPGNAVSPGTWGWRLPSDSGSLEPAINSLTAITQLLPLTQGYFIFPGSQPRSSFLHPPRGLCPLQGSKLNTRFPPHTSRGSSCPPCLSGLGSFLEGRQALGSNPSQVMGLGCSWASGAPRDAPGLLGLCSGQGEGGSRD